MVDLSLLQALQVGEPSRPAVIVGERCISAGLLADLARGAMAQLVDSPAVVGLLGGNSVAWIAALVGLEALGRTIVPLPPFFSRGQLAHIVADAGIGLVLADEACRPLLPDMPVLALQEWQPTADVIAIASDARQVIYTSGSTGAPKGVMLTAAQASDKARLLAWAIHAESSDRVLSILPFALLLEQIAAIRAPIFTRSCTVLTQRALPALGQGNPGPLIAEAEAAQPTVCVVVPEVLKGWTLGLLMQGRRAPASLRYVAVGGAAVSPALAEQAWAAGIPAHEGYGLSEAGSVVSLARPGQRKPGSAGKPLPGLSVKIVDGEIMLAGPQVMQGYLNREPPGTWLATGDLGRLDADGFLIIEGRKDAMLRLSTGRNLHPEWPESLLAADPAVLRAVVLGDGCPRPIVIAELAPGAAPTAVLGRLLGLLPDYAMPDRIAVLPPGTFAARGLLTGNGRIRRVAVAAERDSLLQGHDYYELLSATAS